MDPIRKWFIDHEDEEFAIRGPGEPFTVVPLDLASSKGILYTTKPATVCPNLAFPHSTNSLGVIGLYGLPAEEDIAWLIAASARQRLRFLGDADPPDLLIFSWLRARMDIEFSGLNDRLLQKCGVALDDGIAINQSPSEVAALPFVNECLPETDDLLGPGCKSLLSLGRKIEVESLFSRSELNRDDVFAAILDC